MSVALPAVALPADLGRLGEVYCAVHPPRYVVPLVGAALLLGLAVAALVGYLAWARPLARLRRERDLSRRLM